MVVSKKNINLKRVADRGQLEWSLKMVLHLGEMPRYQLQAQPENSLNIGEKSGAT